MKRSSKMPGRGETTGELCTSLDIPELFRVKITGSKSEACLILSYCFDLSEWVTELMVVKKTKRKKILYN